MSDGLLSLTVSSVLSSLPLLDGLHPQRNNRRIPFALFSSGSTSIPILGMAPTLSSLINYKSGRNLKPKVAIKSTFAYLRGESSSSAAPPPQPQAPYAPKQTYVSSEVIDIGEGARYSLEIDGGKPRDEYEKDLVDEPRYPRADIAASPQVQLDIDVSPQGLSDWFMESFRSSTYKPNLSKEQPQASGSGLQNQVSNSASTSDSLIGLNGNSGGDIIEDDDHSYTTSSEDVIATLEGMGPSHFGKMPGYDSFKRKDQLSPKKPSPNAITIPAAPLTQNNEAPASALSPDIPSGYTGTFSSGIDTPASSAISGTTLARALMSNSFALPSENRLSRYRSSVAGLTRSDSTTLPRGEHSFGAHKNDRDRFSIAPDAPPVPSNAEFLYEPPKIPRKAGELAERRSQNLRRRSSTGSLNPRTLPETPSTTSQRPNSVLFSPGVEFDMNSILRSPESQKPPSLPRSPLPPTPRLPYSAGADQTSFIQDSLSDKSYQELIQKYPQDSELMSPDLNSLSPSASSEGHQAAKNYEDVLNYYSLPDSPGPNFAINGYRPAFSPISEESTSQLSPPIQYRGDKRDSVRSTPVGARSPLSGSIRLRGESVPLPRKPSEARRQNSLTVLSERPRSVTQLPSPSSAHTTSTFASAGSDLLAPPPLISHVFNRARAGSAPSPIIVVRDSKDANAYKITLTPGMSESGTPTDGQEQFVTQEFPETPDAFSPLITSGTNGSPSRFHLLDGQEVVLMPMPNGPMSATFPARGSMQPPLGQILLNRAGTTVKPSRQTAISKIKTNGFPPRRSGSPSSRRISDIAEGLSDSPSTALDQLASILNVSTDSPPVNFADAIAESPEELPASPGPIMLPTIPDISRPVSRSTSLTQGSDTSSMYTPSIQSESSRTRTKNLPPIPVSPPPSLPSSSAASASGSNSAPSLRSASPIPLSTEATSYASATVPTPTPPPVSSASVSSSTSATGFTPVIPPPPTIPPPSPTPSQRMKPPAVRGRLPPALTITNSNVTSAERAVAVNGSGETASEASPVPFSGEMSESTKPPSANAIPVVPPPSSPLPPVQPSQEITMPSQGLLMYKEESFSGRASDIFRGTSLGSPPPYYTVVSDAINQNEGTPPHQVAESSFSRLQNYQFGGHINGLPPPSATTSTNDWGNHSNAAENGPSVPLARENSVAGQRGRRRPPLPIGPRRPSQIQITNTNGSSSSLQHFLPLRDRAGSVSSVASTNPLIHASRGQSDASPAFSPKFQTPAPKWRGYTMEAAKWTFTSAQLQAIVSRAIRQSAEASSIRLLRLEILDNEIPEEIQRLEAQRTDAKTRYKVLVRRRTALFDALSSSLTNAEDESPSHALRFMEDLKELTVGLDRIAEELHSLDGQLAHLESLTHIHSGSALAMALRKLNSSFLKQVAENQVLRNQIQAVEAERDEAWKQAEFVANEFDRINDKLEDISSKRSSRVSAVRKSSIRVSKAGLRTPSQRLSQLSSSHGSVIHYGGLGSGSVKSPMLRLERAIPPVPPMPRRRTFDSMNSPLKSSAALSSTGLTPTSETRALVQAQDELYAMLGLTNPERSLRRSLSHGMLREQSPVPTSAHFQHSHLRPNLPANVDTQWRRSSLPGDDALAETYNAMAADRNAVLATIDMLSSTD